eukprot:TRINITY_DN12548_c0_g1_i5.p1 TRINITY_DN12548_c0_g1~~TRINITY_DN12548_c0_g1_i5.p1  ORF type:complete len:596 (+),score=62.36 TRINITY_DN12548_c0_g1_i5:402-2189(+)
MQHIDVESLVDKRSGVTSPASYGDSYVENEEDREFVVSEEELQSNDEESACKCDRMVFIADNLSVSISKALRASFAPSTGIETLSFHDRNIIAIVDDRTIVVSNNCSPSLKTYNSHCKVLTLVSDSPPFLMNDDGRYIDLKQGFAEGLKTDSTLVQWIELAGARTSPSDLHSDTEQAMLWYRTHGREQYLSLVMLYAHYDVEKGWVQPPLDCHLSCRQIHDMRMDVDEDHSSEEADVIVLQCYGVLDFADRGKKYQNPLLRVSTWKSKADRTVWTLEVLSLGDEPELGAHLRMYSQHPQALQDGDMTECIAQLKKRFPLLVEVQPYDKVAMKLSSIAADKFVDAVGKYSANLPFGKRASAALKAWKTQPVFQSLPKGYKICAAPFAGTLNLQKIKKRMRYICAVGVPRCMKAWQNYHEMFDEFIESCPGLSNKESQAGQQLRLALLITSVGKAMKSSLVRFGTPPLPTAADAETTLRALTNSALSTRLEAILKTLRGIRRGKVASWRHDTYHTPKRSRLRTLVRSGLFSDEQQQHILSTIIRAFNKGALSMNNNNYCSDVLYPEAVERLYSDVFQTSLKTARLLVYNKDAQDFEC